MSNGATRPTRLLFVIDHDFGALGTVMYLLHRQPMSAHATLALPRRAYELNQGRLPLASRPYQSLRDILDIVESESPDVVFLFSGYLIASQGLITFRDLHKLIRALRARRCKVVTHDPFLGTYSQVADIDNPAGVGDFQRKLEMRLAKHPRVRGIVARLARLYAEKQVRSDVRSVAASLRDVTHIYPVPFEPSQAGGTRRISFFNPLYIRSPDEVPSNAAAHAPSWLFVLAQFDLDFQEQKYGRQRFVEIVAARIRDALGSGRHPIFIGPAAVTHELSSRFAPDSGVSFLPTCSFEEFQQRLLEAEIVFYWQIFSTSAFFRLWNGLPVFFFDQGHIARVLGPLRDAGLKHYYLGGPPIYLDIERPLDAAQLEQMSAGFRESAQEARRLLAGLPTPAQMVGTITAAS